MQIFTKEQALQLASRAVALTPSAALTKAFDVRELAKLGLAQRIIEAPGETLTILAGLPTPEAVSTKAPPAEVQAQLMEIRKACAAVEEARPAKKQARRGGKRKRSARTTPEQLEALKAKVRQMLKERLSGTRKEICKAAGFTGFSLYNRLIKSMANELKAKGQRSKRVYTMK